MKTTIPAFALIAALTLGASPAAASPPQDFRAWLADAIDRNMEFPAALERSHDSGVATVRFSVDGNGRPVDVQIVESSGSRVIDRAAMRTIATLDVPAGAPAGPHLAVLQYGTEVGSADATELAGEMDAATGNAQLALREINRQRQGYAETGATAHASTID
ncbi:MAG: energy transducer TonB [Allosphingosinicella sp.]